MQLAEYQTRYGDWRELFRELDRVDKVTKADVRRVANKVFVASNRTSARMSSRPPAQPPWKMPEVRNDIHGE
jgi:predicted Zn-dependent peptidase